MSGRSSWILIDRAALRFARAGQHPTASCCNTYEFTGVISVDTSVSGARYGQVFGRVDPHARLLGSLV